jgi:hypothetical protein
MAFLGTMRSSYRVERAVRATKPPRTPLTVRAARLIGGAAARVSPSWAALRTLLLTVTAFTLIDVAAWQWHTWSGLVVTALSLLAFEALTGSDSRPT